MTHLLITSCFNANPLFALAVHSPASGETRFVDLSSVPVNCYFRGIAGAAKVPGGFVVGLQSNGPSKLLFLDHSLHVQRVVPLELTWDIHSMVERDGVLTIVSTGNDSVTAFDLATGRESTLRRFTESGKDTLHLNGLCLHQGRFFVSMFGAQAERSMRCGSVVALDTGETVLGGLRHPHSLVSDGTHMALAESLTGTIVAFDADGRLGVQRPGYFGYIRGLAALPGRTFVARSKKRKISRSTGALVEGGHPMDWLDVEQPALYDIAEGRPASQVDLLPFCDEVYDLLAFEAEGALNLIDLAGSAGAIGPRQHAAAVQAQRRGDHRAAIEALQAIPAPSAPQLLLLSRSQFAVGEAVAARETARHALGDHHGHAETHHWMSRLLEIEGDLAAALESSERAVALDDGIALHLLQLGELRRRLGRFDEAATALRRAVALNPRLEVAERGLAAALAGSTRDEGLGGTAGLQRLTDWRAA